MFEICANDTLVGRSALEPGYPPRGVAFGQFIAAPGYRKIQQECRASLGDQTSLALSVKTGAQSCDGYFRFGLRELTFAAHGLERQVSGDQSRAVDVSNGSFSNSQQPRTNGRNGPPTGRWPCSMILARVRSATKCLDEAIAQGAELEDILIREVHREARPAKLLQSLLLWVPCKVCAKAPGLSVAEARAKSMTYMHLTVSSIQTYW
jgi:hypothetical protein